MKSTNVSFTVWLVIIGLAFFLTASLSYAAPGIVTGENPDVNAGMDALENLRDQVNSANKAFLKLQNKAHARNREYAEVRFRHRHGQATDAELEEARNRLHEAGRKADAARRTMEARLRDFNHRKGNLIDTTAERVNEAQEELDDAKNRQKNSDPGTKERRYADKDVKTWTKRLNKRQRQQQRVNGTNIGFAVPTGRYWNSDEPGGGGGEDEGDGDTQADAGDGQTGTLSETGDSTGIFTRTPTGLPLNAMTLTPGLLSANPGGDAASGTSFGDTLGLSPSGGATTLGRDLFVGLDSDNAPPDDTLLDSQEWQS